MGIKNGSSEDRTGAERPDDTNTGARYGGGSLCIAASVDDIYNTFYLYTVVDRRDRMRYRTGTRIRVPNAVNCTPSLRF